MSVLLVVHGARRDFVSTAADSCAYGFASCCLFAGIEGCLLALGPPPFVRPSSGSRDLRELEPLRRGAASDQFGRAPGVGCQPQPPHQAQGAQQADVLPGDVEFEPAQAVAGAGGVGVVVVVPAFAEAQ